MTYDKFIKKHKGKAMDYDGCAGAQCVDLAKYYLDEVFGLKPGAWGDAYAYFYNFNNIPDLKNNFTRIYNTPSFVPKKGDIAVWKTSLNGKYGHIAICTGEGNTSYFYSYDQNWTGNHDAATKIKHNYNHFYGVLRAKDQTKITGLQPLDTYGFKLGVNTVGGYTFKKMLGLKGHKLDDNGQIDKKTVAVINKYLKKWNYKQNGIAGKKFVQKFINELNK